MPSKISIPEEKCMDFCLVATVKKCKLEESSLKTGQELY